MTNPIQQIADELRSEAPKLGFCYNQLDDANTESVVKVVVQRVLDRMKFELAGHELAEEGNSDAPFLHHFHEGLRHMIEDTETHFNISTAANYFVNVRDETDANSCSM